MATERSEQLRIRAELRSALMQNLPQIREVAPNEYEQLLKNGEVLADKLSAFMRGVVAGRKDLVPAKTDIAAAPAVEVGAIVVAVVAGEVAAQRAGSEIVEREEIERLGPQAK